MIEKNKIISLLASVVLLLITPAIADESNHMTVFKTPWCGCCQVWTEAMEKEGYKVTVRHVEDLTNIRKQAGVSEEIAGCHTALVDGYVLEGHVPLQAIRKLMSKRPKIRGLSVPGMPQGSLGMGYDPKAHYDVLAIHHDGSGFEVFYRAGNE